MPAFSARSLSNLAQCHPDLQKIFKLTIVDCPVDFGITCGWRSQAEQAKLVAEGKSKTLNSKHNHSDGWGDPCSLAVDVLPYLGGKDAWTLLAAAKTKEEKQVVYDAFEAIFQHTRAIADSSGLKLRWGGDFSMDDDKTTNDAWDKPHIELVGAYS